MSTPVVIDGHAYLHARSQRLVCLDLKSGAKRWETEAKFGKYQSLVAQGRRILALDERGILYLIAADPDRFTLLSVRKVSDDETWAHLAVDGTDVVVRGLGGVTAWTWRAPGT